MLEGWDTKRAVCQHVATIPLIWNGRGNVKGGAVNRIIRLLCGSPVAGGRRGPERRKGGYWQDYRKHLGVRLAVRACPLDVQSA